MWRSLVAHLTGGQGVAGSSPVIPTIFTRKKGQSNDWPLFLCYSAGLNVGVPYAPHYPYYDYLPEIR